MTSDHYRTSGENSFRHFSTVIRLGNLPNAVEGLLDGGPGIGAGAKKLDGHQPYLP